MRLLRQLRAVLWSFVGVRRGAEAARDLEGIAPTTLVAVGLLAGGLFVATILLVVQAVTGGTTAPVLPSPRSSSPAQPPQNGAFGDNIGGTTHTRASIPDTMAERMRPCATCHGGVTAATPDGYSPRIAGKPAGYLENQLRSFRDGRRTYAPMVTLVQFMSDDYLAEIARYFAALELPYPAPERAPPSVTDRGRAVALVEHGDAARDVPACSSCHGIALTGMEPAIPALLGLPRDYINAQLGAWRNGKLRSLPPDCMAEVARRLAPDDVPALSAWLASHPLAADMHAAPASATSLPLACGGVAAARR